MLCVFCNQPYTDAEGCCDKAAMSIALTALQYHADCDHQEPKDAMAQLRKRLAGQPSEFMAFFVGGPANGMTQYLPKGRVEYRYFTPEVVDAFTNLGMATPHTEVGKIRYHLYLATKEMRHPYYKGCYIFEWIGERG